MYNPFDVITEKLESIEQKISSFGTASSIPQIEIIDRSELEKRLGLTEPTIIRYEKRGKIPRIEIGSAVRYNWPAVIAALENPKNR